MQSDARAAKELDIIEQVLGFEDLEVNRFHRHMVILDSSSFIFSFKAPDAGIENIVGLPHH